MSNEPRHGPVTMDKAIARDLLRDATDGRVKQADTPETTHAGDDPAAVAARTGDGGTPAHGDDRPGMDAGDGGTLAKRSGKTGKASGPNNAGDHNDAGSA